jgi:hypothetical protein
MKGTHHFMKQSLSTIGAALVLAVMLSPLGARASARSEASHRLSMSVKILSSSGPVTIGRKKLVTLHLHVQGLMLDAKHIGKNPVVGRGHIQVYLDRVPSDAFKTPDLRGMVAISAGEFFSVDLSRSPARNHPGKHRLIVTLARNNYVLYRTKTPAFSITVR